MKEIRYTINGGPEQVIPGNHGIFILHDDGDDIHVEYWAIDNVGNIEPKNSFTIDIDQTKPEIDLYYEILGGNKWQGWDLLFTANSFDDTSNMDRVEFYLNDELQKNISGPGPIYEWNYHYPSNSSSFSVRGLIRNLEITDEYVKFNAIIVIILGLHHDIRIFACSYDNAGNLAKAEIIEPTTQVTIIPGFYLFQNLTLPNNYTGYIGRFFISAIFNNS